MNDTEEALYDGPDPFLHGVTVRGAAYLETLSEEDGQAGGR